MLSFIRNTLCILPTNDFIVDALVMMVVIFSTQGIVAESIIVCVAVSCISTLCSTDYERLRIGGLIFACMLVIGGASVLFCK